MSKVYPILQLSEGSTSTLAHVACRGPCGSARRCSAVFVFQQKKKKTSVDVKMCGGGVLDYFLLFLLLTSDRCCSTPTDRKVCQGMSNQLTMLGTAQNHYNNMVKMYANCSVVLDNLEITHILQHQDLSFLQSIQEVGGYVLIAINQAPIVPLVNLKLIRGQNLYEGQYALLVMSNYHRNNSSSTVNYTSGVRQLQLSSLTEILRGGVKITHNHLLCNMDTIQWEDILDKTSKPTLLLKMDDYARGCEPCHQSCVNGSCWAAGQEHCQKFTKTQCAEQCSRRCRGPKPSDCCNEHCAAGCTGPRATDCLACRLFNDNGTCKDACPPATLYDLKTHLVINNPNARFTYGATCVKSCPRNYVVTGGSCVRTCGPGMYEVDDKGVQRCRTCEGVCPKACDGLGVGALSNTMAIDAFNIDLFQNCTKINGNIYLIQSSFSGDAHFKIPPMDPVKLEYFRTVKEITGCLLITSWPVNVTSLSVFENLEIIRGRTTYSDHSLVVVNLQNLQWLGLRSLEEVSAGNVIVKDNPQLCYTRSDQWGSLFRSPDQLIKLKNVMAPQLCQQQNHTCDEQCSDQGCWGPGPTMCVSCRHFDRRGRCVALCHLLHGEPREVAANSSCVECHGECLVMDETPTCHGAGPDQCSKCARFKDGLHCVPRCPHGVMGDSDLMIWKYADGAGQCQPCHQNCTEGCTGPGLSGCSGASSHSTLAVGVVSGLLVIVLLAVVVFVLLRRRQIKRKRTLRRLLQERELVEPLTPSGEAPNQALLRMLKETELKKIRVLGSGAFGTVYKGVWIPDGENVKIPVAIKVLREATSPKANKEILDEAYVMASVDHPHVCRLLGICLTSSVQLVTQLMAYGCLLDYVRHHQENVGAQWLLNWCVQIAKGMSYLEERHLVHRDLAARNVLVKTPNHVKITDFGLAKLLTADENEYHSDGGKVPIKWMALESILQWTYTHQSDVWSYGVTVWELMTFGSKPYDSIPASEVASVLERGERLPQPPICTIDVYMLMVKCWMIDPSSRPRFRELVVEFSKMARDPSRYLVLQCDPPSPSDGRFYSRLLSSDDTDDVVDVEEYLLPYKGPDNHSNAACRAAAHPTRTNSLAMRYISDPTGNMADQVDLSVHKYINQAESGPSSRLADVHNPNYEDLSLAWGVASPPFLSEDRKAMEGPEYLNTAQSSLPRMASLDNPDYQADFLPLATPSNMGAGDHEYLGLAGAMQTSVC
ncbi:melanoma receptor tyrosine-protein kinase-like [Entelurus aequoreus]|uniref:melanoma receptor tyrosine-protein kinase-like n=1 Tax=Entelurus aequoreus TaxID=161455 RepID=UPI002B1D9F25|nr:melanoma receptor tyrosine-protein kinase-like [Entelurus aequoreus]